MGRLIDADKLLETLQDLEPHCENKNYKYGMLSTIRYYMPKIINDEPTAFDTDKVVEQLESELRIADKEKERCARENPLQFDSAKGYAMGLSNAIEIVKAGGADAGSI